MMSTELGEGTRAAIAQQLRIPLDEVDQAVDKALENDLTALNQLWRATYLAAVQGNQDAQTLTLRIAQFRQEITAHLRTHRYPISVEASPETPTQAVRSAWSVLAGNAPHVAQTLVDIALHGDNDGTRVTASIAILDRVGLGRVERSEIAVHLLDASAPTGDAPAQAGALVRDRLAVIAARSRVVDADPGA